MALHLIGTKAANSLQCLAAWSQVLNQGDVAAIGSSIVGDGRFGSLLSGGSAGPTGMLGTAVTHSNTTLDTLVSVSGAPINQIQVGDLILGPGIPLGTFVAIAPVGAGTSITMSQAATASAGINVAILRNKGVPSLRQEALLHLPRGRGIVKVLPGDVVAVDSIGFPYLIPGNAISYAGSNWTFL